MLEKNIYGCIQKDKTLQAKKDNHPVVLVKDLHCVGVGIGVMVMFHMDQSLLVVNFNILRKLAILATTGPSLKELENNKNLFR